ncbi:universal stress protein, partial [Massilia sp. CT11-108]
MYDRILIPTDGSDVSAAAEQAAIAFARAHG